MQKEILTIENIRYDLRNQIREGLWPFGLCTGLTILFFFVFIKIVGPDDTSAWNFVFSLVGFQFVLVLLAFITLDVVLAVPIYRRFSALKNLRGVVIDRLARKELKYRPSRYRPNERHWLYFVSYGKYEIPDANYEWSELYYMGSKMVDVHADCGDEFYLVLSKPHAGKVLLAYNTKMFDYQPTNEKSYDK